MSKVSSSDRRLSAGCVFCLENAHLPPKQVLDRGNHFYLCAPKGQMVEGFLVIAPYGCVPALTAMPPEAFRELAAIQSRVRQFYADAYARHDVLFYEQGRGGGGARIDGTNRFPLHSHLCSLPAAVDLHSFLAQTYSRIAVPSLSLLDVLVGRQPYLYVEADGLSAAYVGKDDHQKKDIESARLKPVVAALMGIAAKADWRSYPGEEELEAVLRRWDCSRQASDGNREKG